jgi:hypothetical protein
VLLPVSSFLYHVLIVKNTVIPWHPWRVGSRTPRVPTFTDAQVSYITFLYIIFIFARNLGTSFCIL